MSEIMIILIIAGVLLIGFVVSNTDGYDED